MKKLLKAIIIILIIIVIIGAAVLGINSHVKSSVKDRIIDDPSELEDFDCILVLGAGIRDDGPSPMLADRLDQAVDLYNSGVSDRLLMSGDHGSPYYDEVNIMKQYAKNCGVPSENIFMDHAGFSSYDSIYRAKEIFGAQRLVIVTQEYHLYRALYIADKLGLDAYGVCSDPRRYAGHRYRELREILARDKDFFKCIFKPEPKYLGEKIPITGNGDVTNDK